MPYNNNPIIPPREITGTVSLPLARIKRIIATDDDVHMCSNNAAFAITMATEMFLQYIVEQSFNIARAEKKPRRNIQYRDIASAVARVENLEFLSDVVPKTVSYKQVKRRIAKDAANGVQPGQSSLDHHMEGPQEGPSTTGVIAIDDVLSDDGPTSPVRNGRRTGHAEDATMGGT